MIQNPNGVSPSMNTFHCRKLKGGRKRGQHHREASEARRRGQDPPHPAPLQRQGEKRRRLREE